MSIKEKLTKEEAIRRHRLMWNYIADESARTRTRINKVDALIHFRWEKMPFNLCWCCEYAICNTIYLHRTIKDVCCFCPIKWKTELCHDKGGEYDMWRRYIQDGNYEKAAEMARVIANLPEKED